MVCSISSVVYGEIMIPDLYKYYEEPHRYYHNNIHIQNMLSHLMATDFHINQHDRDLIKVAIEFHDVIYNPHRDDNELMSMKMVDTFDYADEQKSIIKTLIQFTDPKTYSNPYPANERLNELIRIIRYLDLWDLIVDSDKSKAIINTMNISKEYSFVRYGEILSSQLQFMKHLKSISIKDITLNQSTLDSVIGFLSSYKPHIGIYAGSFNPFHIGHMSVLEQADKHFDQVIVALPTGSGDINQLRNTLPVHHIIEFDTSLPDLMLKYSCQDGGDVTLIRGIRDQNDLVYEKNLAQIYKDMGMKNNIVYFMTEYPHVSSTIIRSMIKDDIDWSLYKSTKYNYLR